MSPEVNRKNKNKYLGQFFTPERVADFLVDWVLGAERITSSDDPERIHRILDPAIGNGIFFKSILDKLPNINAEWFGFDLDLQCLNSSRQALEDRISKTSILNFFDRDFLLQKEDQKFDVILCNPPYRKISDKNYSKELIHQFEGQSDKKLPGTANLYVFFLLKCLNMIDRGGRAAFLVPQDFFNSGYGVFIKSALQESGLLHSLFLLSPQDSLFDEAVTSSCILLLENSDKVKKSGFYWTRLKPGFFSDKSKLLAGSVESIETDWIPFPDPEAKWSPIFHRLEKKIQMGEKRTDTEKENVGNYVPLLEFGKFTRGIATGDNDFFLFTKEMVDASGIPEKHFKTCIPKSQYARNKIFLYNDWEELSKKGAKVWLLDVKLEYDPSDSHALQNHLQSGITRGGSSEVSSFSKKELVHSGIQIGLSDSRFQFSQNRNQNRKKFQQRGSSHLFSRVQSRARNGRMGRRALRLPDLFRFQKRFGNQKKGIRKRSLESGTGRFEFVVGSRF